MAKAQFFVVSVPPDQYQFDGMVAPLSDTPRKVLSHARRSPAHPAPRHLFTGIDLWEEGKPAEALEQFRAVLALQPHNDLARSYGALCELALGESAQAAETWRRHGFSDNTLFRVRVAEHVERTWLEHGDPDQARAAAAEVLSSDNRKKSSLRKALNRFYRRDFPGVLRYVSPAPVENELEAFLGATALEMLGQYSEAKAYLEMLVPRRSEWPDALVALNARLDLRLGKIREAARDFATVVVMGPEDFGINYYMGIVCLAYEKPAEARQYFLRAFTNYTVDTLEFQWWQIEQRLLNPPALNTQNPTSI